MTLSFLKKGPDLWIFLHQEKEKIVLYIPPGENIDRKIKNIGLCEALVKFTQ